MPRDLAAIEADIALLDAVLEFSAEEPVDLTDPEWVAQSRSGPARRGPPARRPLNQPIVDG